MKSKTLFLVWQDPKVRCWYPVGRLTFDGTLYQFVYIQGARRAQQEAGFQPLLTFPSFTQVYESMEIFPLFANRVMPSTRPEYKQLVEWLSLPQNEADPMAFLARTGGARATDSFELLACPEPDEEGNYRFHFPVHGLRYLPPIALERIERLQPGENLLMAADFQNPYEKNAIILRTLDNHLVGYCPGYVLEDALNLLSQCEFCEATVERVNPPATPIQFRLLCRLTACWPEGFSPFSTPIYNPILQVPELKVAVAA